jgi:hypothetical protein
MKGFHGTADSFLESVMLEVIGILQSNNARIANPVRLLEHGLAILNPLIRILFWVTAIDGILMAVKEKVFVDRLCGFLGSNTAIFPPDDGVSIVRSLRVVDVAKDLFTLRSEIAQGREIGQKFWKDRPDLRNILPESFYPGPPRYSMLLEEAALALLTSLINKICVGGLLSEFADPKLWARKMKQF